MSRPKNADQVTTQKYDFRLTAVLLIIPNIQGCNTTEKSRSLLGLLETETEGTRTLLSFGKRL
jgi:predicted deacetylase